MDNAVEPWIRGTLTDIDPVRRAVLHSLELAVEDTARWAAGLSDAEMFERPAGLPPVAFHLRHIVRSLDRLLTYAEARQLDEAQLTRLQVELNEQGSAAEVLAEFFNGVDLAMERVKSMAPQSYTEPRGVGRRMLPTTVVGLLIHCAEHTQRHIGQMVTTAKIVASGRI